MNPAKKDRIAQDALKFFNSKTPKPNRNEILLYLNATYFDDSQITEEFVDSLIDNHFLLSCIRSKFTECNPTPCSSPIVEIDQQFIQCQEHQKRQSAMNKSHVETLKTSLLEYIEFLSGNKQTSVYDDSDLKSFEHLFQQITCLYHPQSTPPKPVLKQEDWESLFSK